VRGGGIEIGHLAAPPRSAASAEGVCRNLARARRVVGTAPRVENIATLVMPPASTLDEAEWTGRIVAESGVELLLDLHNLYANAVNFGNDPIALLRRFPLDRVGAVHPSGGRWIAGPNGARRLLDDHLHDVPSPVFALLQELGRLAPQPLTVIIERDGRYPPMPRLLAQLEMARAALAAGRAAAVPSPPARHPDEAGTAAVSQDAPAAAERFEAFLARLYTDEAALAAFLAAPEAHADAAGLDPAQAAALAAADHAGLVMAANSFRVKRAQYRKRRRLGWPLGSG
jgi:hypothetical protein